MLITVMETLEQEEDKAATLEKLLGIYIIEKEGLALFLGGIIRGMQFCESMCLRILINKDSWMSVTSLIGQGTFSLVLYFDSQNKR